MIQNTTPKKLSNKEAQSRNTGVSLKRGNRLEIRMKGRALGRGSGRDGNRKEEVQGGTEGESTWKDS